MSRLVVHAGTGTILDASECVLVDTDLFDDHDMARLSGDDYFDDGVVVEIAERCGVAVPSVADSARWLAFVGGKSTSRAQLRELLESFICPSCESAGRRRSLVNPLNASVVPWDVLGDARSFAFVCDECASGSAVVL
jgi:hypothetical protein